MGRDCPQIWNSPPILLYLPHCMFRVLLVVSALLPFAAASNGGREYNSDRKLQGYQNFGFKSQGWQLLERNMQFSGIRPLYSLLLATNCQLSPFVVRIAFHPCPKGPDDRGAGQWKLAPPKWGRDRWGCEIFLFDLFFRRCAVESLCSGTLRWALCFRKEPDTTKLRIWTLRFGVSRAQDCFPRDRCSVGTRHAFFSVILVCI